MINIPRDKIKAIIDMLVDYSDDSEAEYNNRVDDADDMVEYLEELIK